jgi:hypothetical protein
MPQRAWEAASAQEGGHLKTHNLRPLRFLWPFIKPSARMHAHVRGQLFYFSTVSLPPNTQECAVRLSLPGVTKLG